MSATTRHWLAGAKITVSPGRSPATSYLAAIHLASGLECTLTVTPTGGSAESFGK